MKYKTLDVVNMTDKELVTLALEQNDRIHKLGCELENCRNELCLKCGNYHQSYAGACDGCRYRRDGEWRADLDE